MGPLSVISGVVIIPTSVAENTWVSLRVTFTLLLGVVTPLLTARGPPCRNKQGTIAWVTSARKISKVQPLNFSTRFHRGSVKYLLFLGGSNNANGWVILRDFDCKKKCLVWVGNMMTSVKLSRYLTNKQSNRVFQQRLSSLLTSLVI